MSMDDENRAIVHYGRRLAASAFGMWVSWMAETKSMEEGAEVCAVDYCTTVTMERFIAGLRWLVRNSAKREYSLILADTMRKLLLKRQGVIHLQLSASKHDRRRRVKCTNALAVASKRSTAQHRLFWRWKRWYFLREDTSVAIRNAISRSGRWQASVQNALTTWATLSHWFQQLKSNQLRARQHWVKYKKLYFIGKLRRLAARRCAQRVVEPESQDVLLRQRLVRGFRALLRQVDRKEDRNQAVRATTELAQQQAGRRLLRRLRAFTILSTWHGRSLPRAGQHCRLVSQVRVIRALLRGMMKRLKWRAPLRTRVEMFLVHSWATRRKSAALAQWECSFARSRLENRRQKIAVFQHRDRTLRLAFAGCRARLCSLACQRSLVYDGVSHHYTKLLRRGWGALSRYDARSRDESRRQLRAALLWKFRREVLALKRLREYVQLRKRKRAMLLEARAAYALSERRAACAEFIRVAQVTAQEGRGSQSDRRRRLASWAARRWRRYVAKRREMRLQPQRVSYLTASPSLIGGSSWSHTPDRSAVQSVGGARAPAAATAEAGAPAAYRRDLHLLSRSKPRAFDVDFVPLPHPPQDSSLEYRYNPSATDTHSTSDGLRRPYAHLLASTPLSRPLPTSRGLQPSALTGVTGDPLHAKHGRDDCGGDQGPVGWTPQRPECGHRTTLEEKCNSTARSEEPSVSRDPVVAPVSVSEEMLLAAEKLLDGGGPSEATMQLLREYLAAQLAAAAAAAAGGVSSSAQ